MTFKQHIKNNYIISAITFLYKNYFETRRNKFGYIHPTAFYRQPILIKGVQNVELHENTSILGHAVILSTNAKFIMKHHSGAAEGLTVVTGSHESEPGVWFRDVTDEMKSSESDKDVIVEEDVWIASNVTILAGVTVGRGAAIGAGSVVRKSVPPYAVVMGNPAKVVGFKFTPEEIIKHEEALYPETERLDKDMIEKNYDKYFIKRIKEIKEFNK